VPARKVSFTIVLTAGSSKLPCEVADVVALEVEERLVAVDVASQLRKKAEGPPRRGPSAASRLRG
jgi:hypothetical protein